MKNLTVVITVLLPLLFSCNDPGLLEEKGKLDLKEVSGLEYIPNSGLWALEDSGNDNKLYTIDEKGNILKTYTVANAKNNDWEDLASDAKGNLYIGDFGNNDNKRRDLAIYKLNAGKYDSIAAKVEFYYPGQKAFPPKKSEMLYDAEAFFEHNGTFYIFTKNRSKGFDGSFAMYSVPNAEGRHEAKLMASLKSCGNYNKCAITAADISPDGKTAVLLSGDKIWLMPGFGDGNYELQPVELGFITQKEGLAFKDADVLFVADEKDKHAGGRLYETKLSILKAKI
ncbi:hypothetical protein OGH69_00140 [Flavobacterium sp. MFBS3-15]|uniref:hypothetical protein n=1 Tax=Flavobacterium sp. MFBS3-15 TaxID=2989816 RepID=UPI00223608BF|nr:hypothetical protein [Flavobacterium sp. MFBS3-15]MCW4467365.1 hypothetical protein [Flavobacterium sp. MFBS3-15]